MDPVRFVICIHNHQPIGNFDWVNEHAYHQAYFPFLSLASDYPEFRFALHTSGCLLEWLEVHHPEYLEMVGRLVERGQIELVGGAMYEPILPIWPQDQIQAQILAHREFTQRWFGRTPEIFWLPERVWEPALAEILGPLGIRGLPVDDSMLRAAGVVGGDLLKPWQCGLKDHPLRLFPISESLRYKIPFAPLSETLEELSVCAAAAPDATLIYADDGEKLGNWPGTHRHVYTGGWLLKFMEGLLAQRWVKLSHFSELLTDTAETLELPAGTYPEMLDWSIRAGGSASVPAKRSTWRNFLSKYTEAGRLEKIVEDFSARYGTNRHLLRAQCNCAYWHGVFGGVYLPHLRSALYEELGRARHEAPPEPPHVHEGQAGSYLALPGVDLCLETGRGMLALLLQHEPGFNWGCTLTRRPEAYHPRLTQGRLRTPSGAQSVHAAKEVRRGDWSRWLVYDPYERGSLVDHFLPGKITLAQFAGSGLPERAAFVREPYAVEKLPFGWSLSASGDIGSGVPLHGSVTKVVRAAGDGAFIVSYSIQCDRVTRGRFGVEWNLTALAPTGPDRWIEVNRRPAGEPRSRGLHHDVTHFGLVDRWGGKALHVECDRPADLMYFGLFTVSQSEKDFELVYQQTAFLTHWSLPPSGRLQFSFLVSTERLGD